MEISPFVTYGPLPPASLRGRDGLVATLVEAVTARRPTALVGPRRYGKTSVLRRVASDLTEVATVFVDLWGATSAADVARGFEEGIDAAAPPFRGPAAQSAVTFGIDLGAIRLSMARPARERPDYNGLLTSLLAVITGTAARVPTLLVIDEISAADRVEGTLAKLRTGLQQHYGTLGLLFAGSEPSTMETIFADRGQPFYNQADLVRIGPLSSAAALGIITDGFAETGRDAGGLHTLAMDLTGGHPHRLMQVADAVWHATPPGGTVGPAAFDEGLRALRGRLADGMERYFGSLPMGHQRVLRLVAHGLSPHGSKAPVVELTPGAASRSRDALLAGGDLIDTEDGLALTDPMLADWLRETLPL